MSNKKIFKELYSKKINKNDNYEAILKSIENKNKNNVVKWIYVPVCLMIIICGTIFLSNTNNNIFKTNTPIINSEQNYQIYINSIKKSFFDFARIDIDIKKENYIMIPYFDFLTNLVIPDDFDNKENFNAIYVKSNINTSDSDQSYKNSNNYDVLNNYELWCRNTKNNRKIIIAFSDKYKPLRDYYFNEEGKVSKINNTELIIYKYENLYMTSFTYNNINFDIETSDITETELIDLLTSIIK